MKTVILSLGLHYSKTINEIKKMIFNSDEV